MQVIPQKEFAGGFSLPVYGLGTYTMGGRAERDFDNDDAADVQTIREAIAAGVRHIDTAESYAAGHTEEILGEALQVLPSGVVRSDLCIASKVKFDLSYDGVIAACKNSLTRLGLSYLDIYYVHRYQPQADLRETMRALDSLVDTGLIKHIGVSNFSKARLIEAQGYARHPIVCNQVHYNLQCREPEADGLLAYCQEKRIALVAYRPLEHGLFAGDTVPALLREVAASQHKTIPQIAISWLTSQPGVVTLAKTSSATQLQENIAAATWQIDAATIEYIRTNFPNQQQVSPFIPLG
jgi:aryl-alcohol dehydrogenase-like predicted oxidoreductase